MAAAAPDEGGAPAAAATAASDTAVSAADGLLAAPKATPEATLEYWRGVDLDGKRATIDAQALAMTDNDEKTLSARAQLAAVTRALKQLPSAEEKVKSFGSVLRAYQAEVDRLSQRGKAAESSFLGLYKLLFEAPDPTHALAAAAADRARAVKAEAECAALKARLHEYDAEFASLKNQEITIRRLEAENKQHEAESKQNEAKLATKVEELARESRRSLEDERAELRRRFAEEESLHAARLQAAKDSLHRALAAHEHTQQQLLEVSAKATERDHTASATAQWLSQSQGGAGEAADEERRAHAAVVATLRAENAELKSQLAAAYGSVTSEAGQRMAGAAAAAASATAAKQLAEQQAIVSSLRATVAQLTRKDTADRTEHDRKLAAADAEVRALQQQLARAQETGAALQRQVSALPSRAAYDALRAKCQLLKDMELIDSLDEDDAEHDADAAAADAKAAPVSAPGPTSAVGAAAATDERVSATRIEASALIRKLRKLESDVTQLKVELSDRTSELTASRAKLAASVQALNEARALAAKLEDDLLAAGGAAATGASRRVAVPPAGAVLGELLAASSATTVPPTATLNSAGATSAWDDVGAGASDWGDASGTDFAPNTASSASAVVAADPAVIALSPTAGGGGLLSPATPAKSIALLPAASPESAPATAGTASAATAASASAAESMLAIVCGQRDRFRKRMEQLEVDKAALQTRCDAMASDVTRLRSDNVALFEKLQYVRSYDSISSGHSKAGAGATDDDLESGGSARPARAQVGGSGGAGGGDDTEQRYGRLYAEKVNPFKEFKAKQRAEAYDALPVTEKITLNAGRLFLTRANARKFLFFYLLLLHVLVFITVYFHTFRSHCGEGGHSHSHSLLGIAGKTLPATATSAAVAPV